MALLFFCQTYDKTGVFHTGTPPPYGMAGNHFTSISGKKNVFSGNVFPGNVSAAPSGVGVSVGVGVGGPSSYGVQYIAHDASATPSGSYFPVVLLLFFNVP